MKVTHWKARMHKSEGPVGGTSLITEGLETGRKHRIGGFGKI